MPYIDNTPLVATQFLGAKGEVQKDPLYGVLRAMEISTAAAKAGGFLTAAISQKLATLPTDQSFQIPVMEETPIATSSAITFSIDPNFGKSNFYAVSKITTTGSFWIVPSQFENNVIAMDEYQLSRLVQLDRAFANSREVNVVNVLNNRRTQVLAGDTLVSPTAGDWNFNTTNDDLEVKRVAQRNNYYGLMGSLLKKNGTFGMEASDMIGVNSELAMTVVEEERSKFGSNNSQNQQNDFNRVIQFMTSSNIVNTSDQGIGYVFKKGALAIVDNNTWEFRMQVSSGDGWQWKQGAVALPRLGRSPNLLFRTAAIDASALGATTPSLTATIADQYLYVDQYFILHTFNSDLTSRVNDIVKIKNLLT